MNEGLIPSRYAKALHLYAEEAGKAAAVYEQTERLAAGYEAHPQMSRAKFLRMVEPSGSLRSNSN